MLSSHVSEQHTHREEYQRQKLAMLVSECWRYTLFSATIAEG